MAVIEAMAAAKPIVATQVGGIPDLVADGETGYLVPVGDAAALACGLERVLQDWPLAKRLGQRGREIATQRFSAAQIAGRYYDLYHRVLAEARATQRGAGHASLRFL